MNYRHAFHAGNFADIVKHAALLEVLRLMMRDTDPVTIIDTHAGGGLYDLSGEESRKSGEAEAGIVRLMASADAPKAFAPLKAAVRRANNGAERVRVYPGSPWLIAGSLRPADRYTACELRPEEHAALAENLKGRRGVRTLCADGFASAPDLSPQKGGVLLLIDPPFERSDDYVRTVETTAAVLRRNKRAIAMIWLPLKDLETFDSFLRDLEDEEPGQILAAEARLRPLTDPMKMNGCALVFVNAPRELEAPLGDICNWVSGSPGLGRVHAY